MITIEKIQSEILKDENIEIEINYNYGHGLEIYHNGVYTDMLLTNSENLTDEVDTVIFNNGQNKLQLSLPIIDEIIGNLYQRVNY